MVLENIHDPHNVSAIFRTCDAVGIPAVSLIYTVEQFPKIAKKTSASAFKWVKGEKHKDVESCFSHLREQGFKILASSLAERSNNLYDYDLTGKVALVMGNEHRGISKEIEEQADELYYIPMLGMVQSLNVSVAAAVSIYEALRQRRAAGMYDEPQLPPDQLEELIEKWTWGKK